MAREACPSPRDDCQEVVPYADRHHLYWPKDEYVTPLEKKFRSLECNVVRGICRCLHKRIHAEEAPPQKPPVQFMRQEVYGRE